MSDINGQGYGDDHNWKCLGTSPFKVTEYRCEDCTAFFRHCYDDIPNIFDALRFTGMSDKCPMKKKEQSCKSLNK